MRGLWRANGTPVTPRRRIAWGVLTFWLVLLAVCLVFWALVILGVVYLVENAP